MFTKYRWNFVFVVLLVTLIGFLIFDVFLYYSIRNYLFRQTYEQLEMKTNMARIIFEEKHVIPTEADDDNIWALIFELRKIVNSRVTIIGLSGEVFYDSDVLRSQVPFMENHSDRPECREALISGSGKSYRKSDTVNRKLFYYLLRI